MKPVITDSARHIICSELKLPFVHSVILIGSRARGDGNAESDYDLYVVIPTSLLPLIFPILKKKEKILKEKLKTDVSITPLTYSRMRRGKDTLLYHIKKEGVVLCGKNIKSEIRINSPLELPPDELFQYFFDALYFLVKDFKLNASSNAYPKIIRGAAKCIIYCAYLKLMMNGIYVNSWRRIMETTKDEAVTYAYKILEKKKYKVKDPYNFWFFARDYAFHTFNLLLYNIYKRKLDLSNFINYYLSSRNSIVRHIQFIVLMLLNRRDLPLRTLFFKLPVDKYLHITLLYLILSINPNLDINKDMLREAYILLRKIIKVPFKESNTSVTVKWHWIKNIIIEHWMIACGKEII